MWKKLLTIAFTLLLNPCVYSQAPSFYHYTSSEGLASSTVYDIIQDHNGYVWFATINGISRFDGKNFKTLRTIDGLNSNSIISLVEGKKGELYIANYEKGINVLRDGRISNYCSEINGRRFATSYLLLACQGVDKQKIYAYRSWGNINTILEDNRTALTTQSIITSPHYINKLEFLPNGELVALTPHGLFSFKNDQLEKIKIDGLPDADLYCLTPCGGNSYFIGTRGTIYLIENEHVIKSIKIQITADNNDVTALLSDKNKNLWFSVMNKGFFLIPNGSDRILNIGITMDLQNTLVNKYLEDKEGNIWLSTFGKGVFCLNNLYLKSYSERDGLSNSNVYSVIGENSGTLLLGTFNGINIFHNGKFGTIKSNSDRTLTEYIYRIKNFNNDVYVCGAFGGTIVRNIRLKGLNLRLFNGPSFCLTSGGYYLYGTGGNA
ncbi:MAG: two-component regulator propeller domain-containing protein, partial [Mariniphaga sp.]